MWLELLELDRKSPKTFHLFPRKRVFSQEEVLRDFERFDQKQ